MKKAVSHFPRIGPIAYEGPGSSHPLALHHYNPDEIVDGRTLSSHLRFSIAYWHSFRGVGSDPFGPGTIVRPWEKGRDPVSIALTRLDAGFEFFQKIRAPFWCFHDRDIAPEGRTLAQSNRNLDRVVAHAKALQKATGVKLLWGTANLFSNPRYMCGAATNPDAHVFAYAAAQVKKAMEVTKELGGENYVFWGGREGYETLLNTNLRREQDHLATFLHLAVDYARQIGFTGQASDRAQAQGADQAPIRFRRRQRSRLPADLRPGQGFQIQYRDQPRHPRCRPHLLARDRGRRRAHGCMLGSIDANTGDPLLGWDTDQFNTDVKELTLGMVSASCGRGASVPEASISMPNSWPALDRPSPDLFHAHIGGMDAYALAFKVARRILAEGTFEKFVADRYSS